MKEIKDCTIVQDLLPNYIDGLTNAQTSEFIKNHLKECSDCQKILKNMKKEIDLNAQKNSKQEVNYIKKFKNHLRTLQVILLVILLAFVIVTGRKTIIFLDLKEKATKYANSTNYYMRISNISFESSLTTQIYRKNDQYKLIWGTRSQPFQTEYYKNGVCNIYHETGETPTAKLNVSQGFEPSSPANYFSGTNFLNLLQGAVSSSITSEICNGKECYRIAFNEFHWTVEATDEHPSYEDTLDSYIIYFNKKTGLPIRVILSAVGSRRTL